MIVSRPRLHLTPQEGWMNDPNGLVFHQGTYHVFYQHHPHDTVWGPMHWGHATTQNWVDWEHHPIALYPDALGTIFSGCAVLDTENHSGLGTQNVPALLAFYTYHQAEKESSEKKDFQTQGLAFSLDHGKTWQMYDHNPVLAVPNSTDFRDPKVFWDAPRQQWVLCLAEGHSIGFYRSDNLLDWTLLSHFGESIGAHGGVWECPDLFPLQTDSGATHWVLLVSINPGGPKGGSATQYFIGDWDGHVFVPHDEAIRWLDHGTDNYAGVTFSQHDHQRLLLGWMNNWDYGDAIPTGHYRGCMTAVRELFLASSPTEGLILGNRLPAFFTERFVQHSLEKHPTNISLKDSPMLLEITWETTFECQLTNSKDESLFLRYDGASLTLDRSGATLNIHPKYTTLLETPCVLTEKKMTLLIDQYTLELFSPKGFSWSHLFFMTSPISKIMCQGINQLSVSYCDI